MIAVPDRSSEPAADQIMPQNVEAEQAVIGAILLHNDTLHLVAPILTPHDFHRTIHANVYEAMLALQSRREPIDYVTVVEQLSKLRRDNERGPRNERREWPEVGIDYLAELAERCPASANALYYAGQVRSRSILRDIIRASADLNREAFEFAGELPEFLEQVERRVFAITQRDTGYREPATMRVCVEEMCNALNEPEQIGLPTGFVALDEKLGGLRKGEFIIAAARPSQGKTSLANCLAINISVKMGRRGLYCQSEMPRVMLTQNMCCALAGVDTGSIRRGYFDHGEEERFINAGRLLRDAPLRVEDKQGITVREIASLARRMKPEYVIVDYIQILGRPGELARSASREQEIATISRQLKWLARELGIPVIALAQLNRENEKGAAPRKPRLSDLRESGSLEQDADVVMLLHREGYYSRNPEDARSAEVNLAKHRNGPTGVVAMRWTAEYVRFEDATDPQTTHEPRPARKAHSATVDNARTGDRDDDDYDSTAPIY